MSILVANLAPACNRIFLIDFVYSGAVSLPPCVEHGRHFTLNLQSADYVIPVTSLRKAAASKPEFPTARTGLSTRYFQGSSEPIYKEHEAPTSEYFFLVLLPLICEARESARAADRILRDGEHILALLDLV